MSEKLTLREKLHIGEKRPDGEKPRMSKKLKKGIIAAACVVGVCGAVWGGLTIARNAQRGDVNVYAVNDFAMTDYWGDTSNTSGMVTTDKLQKIYISQSQTVKKVWVKEGDSVKKGTALVSYDSTLTQATVERAKIDYDRQTENLEVMKNELELLKKAKNKETLEAEYDKLEKELNKLIEDATKSPDDDRDVVDLTHINITDDMKLGTGSGNDKDNAIYYYRTTDSDGGFALSQADLMGIFSRLGKTDGTLYLVFVTRAGNKLGGAVMGNEGYILTAVTEDVPSGGGTGGGEAGGGAAHDVAVDGDGLAVHLPHGNGNAVGAGVIHGNFAALDVVLIIHLIRQCLLSGLLDGAGVRHNADLALVQLEQLAAGPLEHQVDGGVVARQQHQILVRQGSILAGELHRNVVDLHGHLHGKPPVHIDPQGNGHQDGDDDADGLAAFVGVGVILGFHSAPPFYGRAAAPAGTGGACPTPPPAGASARCTAADGASPASGAASAFRRWPRRWSLSPPIR